MALTTIAVSAYDIRDYLNQLSLDAPLQREGFDDRVILSKIATDYPDFVHCKHASQSRQQLVWYYGTKSDVAVTLHPSFQDVLARLHKRQIATVKDALALVETFLAAYEAHRATQSVAPVARRIRLLDVSIGLVALVLFALCVYVVVQGVIIYPLVCGAIGAIALITVALVRTQRLGT